MFSFKLVETEKPFPLFCFLMELQPGKYSYKFVADGTWVYDEEAPANESDGYGGKNSVFEITEENGKQIIKSSSQTVNEKAEKSIISGQYKFSFNVKKGENTLFGNPDVINDIYITLNPEIADSEVEITLAVSSSDNRLRLSGARTSLTKNNITFSGFDKIASNPFYKMKTANSLLSYTGFGVYQNILPVKTSSEFVSASGKMKYVLGAYYNTDIFGIRFIYDTVNSTALILNVNVSDIYGEIKTNELKPDVIYFGYNTEKISADLNYSVSSKTAKANTYFKISDFSDTNETVYKIETSELYTKNKLFFNKEKDSYGIGFIFKNDMDFGFRTYYQNTSDNVIFTLEAGNELDPDKVDLKKFDIKSFITVSF
ncbi:MAG TPA: glycogen-binding domain-containing protein [Tepiditoga sp.]|nr:glycogen-binding domain-containing protein [Tepiditoga sp.]